MFVFVSLVEFAQNPSGFPEADRCCCEGSLGWFRPVGSAKEIPLLPINHEGLARFGQASSHILRSTPSLGG